MSPTTNAELAESLAQVSERIGVIEVKLSMLIDIQARVSRLEQISAKAEDIPQRILNMETWRARSGEDIAVRVDKLEKFKDQTDAILGATKWLLTLVGLDTIVMILHFILDWAGKP